MSLTYEKLNPVEVRDPRTILQSQVDYAIIKSGSQTTWKSWTSPSVSNSSITWSVPPPSGGVFIDSKIYVQIPVRLTFVGNPKAVGDFLINDAYDAPRAYPISGSIETLSATINNQTVNINLSDVIHALSHYNTDPEMKEGVYSTFPSYPDQSQQYSDLQGANRSPLGAYENGIDGTPMTRGGFPFVVISNPAQTVVDGPLTAIVDVVFCEPLFLPPFYFGNGNRQAFYNVNSMDFNFNFVGNMGNRMWSHDSKIVSDPNYIPITSVTAVFGGVAGGPTFSPIASPQNTWATLMGGTVPLLHIQYITPQETQLLSPDMPSAYPYFDIQRYPTQGADIAPHTSYQGLASNNIQLNTIPRRLYVYVRDSNNNMRSTCQNTDTYCSIEGITIQFMNKNGLLASASKQSLYQMCKKNHCNLSWTQWSGCPTGTAITSESVYTIGSVLCIEFATDIGLSSIEAAGKNGQYMLSVSVNYTNNSERVLTPVLYLVPVLEGVFEIPRLGQSMITIGAISSQDILDSQSKPGYSYADIERVGGGNFFSGMRDYFTKNVLPHVKNFVANRGVSRSLATLGTLGVPLAGPASKVAHAFGYGEGEGGSYAGSMAGVYAGEGVMPRKSLQNRMRQY